MYAIVSSCLLQWCPQVPFYPTRYRSYGGTEDDREYEKYQPRPKIVIDPDVASLDSFITESTTVVMCESGEPSLRVAAQYSNQKKTVLVKVIHVNQMDWIEEGASSSVRIYLSSCSKQPKQQTNGQDGPNPVFNETFSFTNVELDELQSTSLKFRVYSRKGRTRAVLRAETRIEGSGISCDGPVQYVLRLERITPLKSEIPSITDMNVQNMPIPSPTGLSPSMHRFSNGNVVGNDSRRSSMVDSCGRFCSQPNNDMPELLISLSYDGDHSNLTIGVERGSQFGEKQKPPDTFIKIAAVGEFGNEIYRQKSEVVKGSIEPNYDHQSSISISKNDLEGITVKIEVWQSVGVLRRRQQMGLVAVGLNSTSPDAQEHWQQMIQGKGMSLSKWHSLQNPE